MFLPDKRHCFLRKQTGKISFGIYEMIVLIQVVFVSIAFMRNIIGSSTISSLTNIICMPCYQYPVAVFFLIDISVPPFNCLPAIWVTHYWHHSFVTHGNNYISFYKNFFQFMFIAGIADDTRHHHLYLSTCYHRIPGRIYHKARSPYFS